MQGNGRMGRRTLEATLVISCQALPVPGLIDSPLQRDWNYGAPGRTSLAATITSWQPADPQHQCRLRTLAGGIMCGEIADSQLQGNPATLIHQNRAGDAATACGNLGVA